MDPERRRQIASLAGKASQASGNGNRFTKAQAKAAGKKGGARSGIVRARKAAQAAIRERAELERGAAPPGVQDPKGAAVAEGQPHLAAAGKLPHEEPQGS